MLVVSRWTHITACFSVDTFIQDPPKKLIKQVKDYLKNAPKITGSESDADIFVNIQSGHNSWTNFDCEHCKYQPTQKLITENGKEYLECDAPVDHDCSAEYQSRIVISIQGDLRDREREQTKEEFKQFRKYLKSEYMIRDYSVNIEGD